MWSRDPITIRRQIPFFHDKTEQEFRLDPYERFEEMVMRQAALHLGDDYWGSYPFQTLVDKIKDSLPIMEAATLLDLGCGVGRLLRELANNQVNWAYYGIDFSYNQLRIAHDCWVEGETFAIDFPQRGLPKIHYQPSVIPGLQLGLAKAEALPFPAASFDVICSTFLLDRLVSPELTIHECHRVLRPGGTLVLASPLNWQHAANWHNWGNSEKVLLQLQQLGWTISKWEEMTISEPLDARGNTLQWNVLFLQAHPSK